MKNTVKVLAIIALVVVIGYSMPACDSGGDGSDNPIAVTLKSVKADGSATQITTQLTLTFDNEITELFADDITLTGVSGVSKGPLIGSNPYYLPIDGFLQVEL